MTSPGRADRLVLGLAAALLVGVAVLPPVAYYLLSLRHLDGSLEVETEVVAREVSGYVTSSPDLWRFQQVRLEEVLQRRLRRDEPESRRVLDAEGRLVAESVDPLLTPLLRRTAPLLDAGAEVGRVEVIRSLRPAAMEAIILALLLGPIAAGAFLALRGALDRAGEVRRELEERLRQAHRLEAIGRLAGGVAHDFNNLLAAVLGFARELSEELPPGSPPQELAGEILAVAQRGVQVTRSLLAFSRQQDLALERADAGQLLRGLERLMRRTLGPGQQLRLELAEAPLPMLADAVQLEMVLVNLVANARDAMAPNGVLRVATSREVLTRREAAALGLGEAAGYARLDVTDDGAGMDQQTRERAFDPFFTTKEVGRGTGLGLALAHGVIQQHHGSIRVASVPGRGTTFSMLFPLVSARDQAGAQADGLAATGAAAGGQELVLLVEDDRQVRRVVGRVLQRAGYHLVEAADGEEAVARFTERREEIELVILDAQLPGLSGLEALKEIRRLEPDARALVVSGNPPEAGAPELAGVEVLQKPVEPQDLLRAVRRAIVG